jgi:hypothetical protein
MYAPPTFSCGALVPWSATKFVCQCQYEFGFPVSDGLVADHETADQEHLGQTS